MGAALTSLLHRAYREVMVRTRYTLLGAAVIATALLGVACTPTTEPDAGTAPAEEQSGDLAGIFEECTDTIFYSLTSPDGRWRASKACDRTLLDGPATHLERPAGYPVVFTPTSDVLLFVSTGNAVERADNNGFPYLDTQLPALYALHLPPEEGDFGTRLMNAGAFHHVADETFVPPPSAHDPTTAQWEWVSEHLFRYHINLPQHEDLSGTFEVDLGAPNPEVRRVP